MCEGMGVDFERACTMIPSSKHELEVEAVRNAKIQFSNDNSLQKQSTTTSSVSIQSPIQNRVVVPRQCTKVDVYLWCGLFVQVNVTITRNPSKSLFH